MNRLPFTWTTLLKMIVLVVVVVAGIFIVARQLRSTEDSFEGCKKAGNPIQESYPEVCVDQAGKRYINPDQDLPVR